ncbi:NAD(P)H-dependent amine dehydrogenase family protein [Phenylobacterium montanum]|uniref:Dihydrodipicolinate reductase N-terminal domain-containing protein n=1 Tax=Phenylobacterium montanum TaxID=2823693 RepID=A0A975G2C2_9CAUL|nr:hypothetical protein [Caulobacter sp. S6]QUD89494.1 hypothetical protein KCG34_06330 [Caulobacter sp. S6]
MSEPPTRRYRVVQWATGAMGKTCLRALIDHPAVELVGVFVYSRGKAGLDAGEIARRPATGVIATNSVEEILALDADVVIHCARISPPYGSDHDEIEQLLAAGKNVISINGHSHPHYWGPQYCGRLEAACAKGGVTLMNAGLNPGFAGEQLAVVASGLCSKIDHLEIVESADGRSMRDPNYVFGVLGFGAKPGSFDPNAGDWAPASAVGGMYAEMLALVAERLGIALEAVVPDHQVFAATEDLHVAAGVIRQGTVSHLNLRWRGIVGGRARLLVSIHWHMEAAHLDEPKPPLWKIRIEGEPCVDIAVDLAKRAGDATRTEPEQIALAGAVINAISVVCAAAPGLLSRPMATPFSARLADKGL